MQVAPDDLLLGGRGKIGFARCVIPHGRGSVMFTSNLLFANWEQIFRNPMTTAAAIDRLVQHSIILELNVPSYRGEAVKKQQKPGRK